jgi:hypothetical protein
MSELIIVLIVAATLIATVPLYVRRLNQDAQAYAVWQDRFFNVFDRLLDNKDTPQVIIKVGLSLGESMRNRRLLTSLLWSILSGGARQPHQKEESTIRSLPARVEEDFLLLIVAWLHALSHTGVVRGYLLRNLMFPIFKRINGEEQNLRDVDQGAVRPYGETVFSVVRHKGRDLAHAA